MVKTTDKLSKTQLLRVQEVATGAPASLALEMATSLQPANLRTGVKAPHETHSTLMAGLEIGASPVGGVHPLHGAPPFATRPRQYGMTPFAGPKGFAKAK